LKKLMMNMHAGWQDCTQGTAGTARIQNTEYRIQNREYIT
jgi:hypothetical protein